MGKGQPKQEIEVPGSDSIGGNLSQRKPTNVTAGTRSKGKQQYPREPATPQEGIRGIRPCPNVEAGVPKPLILGPKRNTLGRPDDSSHFQGQQLGAHVIGKHSFSAQSATPAKEKLAPEDISTSPTHTLTSHEVVRKRSWVPERRVDRTNVIYAQETQATLATEPGIRLYESLYQQVGTAREPQPRDDDTVGIPNLHGSRNEEKAMPHRKGDGGKSGPSRGRHGTSREDWTSERIRQLYALYAARLSYNEMRYFLEENRSINSLKSRVYSIRAGNAGNNAANIAAWNQEHDSGVIWTINRDRTEVTSSDGRRYGRIHSSFSEDHININACKETQATQAKRSTATRPTAAKTASKRSNILRTDAVSDTSDLEPRQIASSPVTRANTLAQPRSQVSAVDISQYQSSFAVVLTSSMVRKRRAAQAFISTTLPAIGPLFAGPMHFASQMHQPAGFLCSHVDTVRRPQVFTTGTSRPALSPYPPSNPPTPEWREQQRGRLRVHNARRTPDVNAEWIHRNYGAGHSAEAAAHAAQAVEVERTHVATEQSEAQQQTLRDRSSRLYWEQRREQRRLQRRRQRQTPSRQIECR